MDAGRDLMRGLLGRTPSHRGYRALETRDGAAMAANEKGSR
jgi:hypothetical protein